MKNGYPFPSLVSGVSMSDCFYTEKYKDDFSSLYRDYEKKISSETTMLKLQYFSIEQEMINSFQYVDPISCNLNTTSVKFATIIRESSNIYEQVSKIIFIKLFGDYFRINIYNYLSLEKFLHLSEFDFLYPTLTNTTSNGFLIQPFLTLRNWDKESSLNANNIPVWWSAYNEIKHSTDILSKYSTLANAILALAAAYTVITKYRGSGVVSGDLVMPQEKNGEIWHTLLPVQKSQLFMTKTDLMSLTY